jgi:hypothetical protein
MYIKYNSGNGQHNSGIINLPVLCLEMHAIYGSGKRTLRKQDLDATQSAQIKFQRVISLNKIINGDIKMNYKYCQL